MGEWLLVDDRHVQRVGSGDPPRADRIVELPGATIVPGFIDTHVHLAPHGIALANSDVEQARSAKELLSIARARALAQAADEAIYLQGYDESRWDDPAVPTLAELDAVTDRPLMIRRADGHTALANTAAVRGAGIEEADGLHRDASGAPTGRLTLRASDETGRWILGTLSAHQLQELQLKAAAQAASHGITTRPRDGDAARHGPRDLEVFLAHRARLPVDAIADRGDDGLSQAIALGMAAVGWRPAGRRLDRGPHRGAGRPVRRRRRRRRPQLRRRQLAEFFHGGHAAGLQVGVHAIGDRAIEQVLGAWERVYQALDSRERRHFRARRHRIEHSRDGDRPNRSSVRPCSGSPPRSNRRSTCSWGRRGGLYEQAPGGGASRGDEPVPDDARPWHRGRARVRRPGHAARPLARGRTRWRPTTTPAQRLSRLEAIRLHTLGGAAARAPGREEGGAGARRCTPTSSPTTSDPFEAARSTDLRPRAHRVARAARSSPPELVRPCHSFSAARALTSAARDRTVRRAPPPRRRRTEDPRG